MMNVELLSNLIKTRRSIRRFQSSPISREIVLKLIESASWAPSACNLQAWDFIVVQNEDLKRKLAENGATYQVSQAPVSIFVCYDNALSKENFANIQSAAAAIQNLILQAHSLGIGSLWATTMGDKKKVKSLLKIPESKELIAVVVLGYPEENPSPPKRKLIEEILHYNQFDKRRIMPSSQDINAWTIEQIIKFQNQKIKSGAKYNKLSDESNNLLDAIVKEVKRPINSWLDIFPCTGVYLEKLVENYPEADFDFWELSDNVIEFIKNRLSGKVGSFKYPYLDLGNYSIVSMIYRLGGVPKIKRKEIFTKIFDVLSQNGKFVLVFTNKDSYFSILSFLRKKIGHTSVENVLAPEVNLGPYIALDVEEIQRELEESGFELIKRKGLFFAPSIKDVFDRGFFKSRPFLKYLSYVPYIIYIILSAPLKFFGCFYKTQLWILSKK